MLMTMLGSLDADIYEVVMVNDPYIGTLYECVILTNVTSVECKCRSRIVSSASILCVAYT